MKLIQLILHFSMVLQNILLQSKPLIVITSGPGPIAEQGKRVNGVHVALPGEGDPFVRAQRQPAATLGNRTILPWMWYFINPTCLICTTMKITQKVIYDEIERISPVCRPTSKAGLIWRGGSRELDM